MIKAATLALFLAFFAALGAHADVTGVAFGAVLQVAPDWNGQGACRLQVYGSTDQSTVDFTEPKLAAACAGLIPGDEIVVTVRDRVAGIVDSYPQSTFLATGLPVVVSSAAKRSSETPVAEARVAGAVSSLGVLYGSGAQPAGCYTVIRVAPGPAGEIRVEWWAGESLVADLCKIVSVGDEIDVEAKISGASCAFDACEAGSISLHGISLFAYLPRRVAAP